METMPVKHYREPGYPTRCTLDAQPDILRAVPQRWHRHATLLAALAATLSLTARSTAQADAARSAPDAALVAPLFVHGDGRGAFGCVAVNPPVFLSEDEARSVIIEEAKRAGITFTPESQALDGVYVPIVDRYASQPAGRRRKTTLLLDGADLEKRLGFVFVSATDLTAWETRFHPTTSTVWSYDVVGTAKALRSYLAMSPQQDRLAVFYDPAVGSQDIVVRCAARRVGDVPMLPVAAIADWLGAHVDATASGTVALTCRQTRVTLTPDTATAKVNDSDVALAAPATMQEKTLYAPAAFLVESLGAGDGLVVTGDTLTLTHPESHERLVLPILETAPTDRRERERQKLSPEVSQQLTESIRALSREELRSQVRDFIVWLKGEGVI